MELADIFRGGVTDDDVTKINKVFECCREVLQSAGIPMDLVPEKVPLNFNLRGAVAGRAWKDKISLNPILFLKNKEDYFYQTIPHEYAHFVVDNIYKNTSDHGWEWRHIMIQMGLTPYRYHNYDVSEVKRKVVRKTYTMGCGCKTHNVSSVVYNRIKSGRSYICKKCRKPLV